MYVCNADMLPVPTQTQSDMDVSIPVGIMVRVLICAAVCINTAMHRFYHGIESPGYLVLPGGKSLFHM